MQQNLYIEKVRILYTTINIKFYLFNFYFKKSRAIIIKGKNIFFILILLNFTIVPYCYNKGIILNPKEQLIEQSIGSLIKLTKKLQDNSLNETSGLIENLEIKAINNQTTQKDHNSRDPSSLTPKNAYAIVIGIENYPGYSYDLYYCKDDASSVYSLLRYDYNFKSENIRYITDSAATKTGIDNAFSIIRSQIHLNDIFFFFYSGHGGGSGSSHYLCPYDSIPSSPSKYYYDNDLDWQLDNLNCAEKYVLIDACRSGGMIPETQASGRYIISACTSSEYSWETSNLHHGVFTYYFLRSISYATDSNGDGVRSVEDLYSYISTHTASYMAGYGESQHPQKYNGITGQAVLYPSLGSVSFNPSDNQLSYSFYLYGHGSINTLNISVCSVSQNITFKSEDLTENSSSSTGFEYYTGTIQLGAGENVTGYEILAKIDGRTLITIKKTYGDTDGDGLYDLFEINEGNGIDPRLNDTDSDGLNDYDEFYGSTDPLNSDTDSDGLLDGLEVNIYFTNPTNNDTDSDGLPDKYEVDYNLDPLFNDTNLDYDNDSLSNLLEFQLGSYPNNPDSDSDGMDDGYENNNGLNLLYNDSELDLDSDGLSNFLEYQVGSLANNADSDGDLMPDLWEYNNGLNLTFNDAYFDFDNDTLSNFLEYQLGSYPNNLDSDADSMPDKWEYNNNLNLTFNDAQLDADLDGLSNINEYLYNTDPQNQDTDGDLYFDGIEVQWGTDPLNPFYSLNTIFLNIIGIAILIITVYYAPHRYVGKKRKIEKPGGKFEINENTEKFNILKVETKIKPIISPPPYKTTTTYRPPPLYQATYKRGYPPGEDINVKKMLIKNYIQHELPPPKSSYSVEGQKAMQVAMAALKFISEGRMRESLDAMMMALQLGVPEPLNSQLKQRLLNSLDLEIKTTTSVALDTLTGHKKCRFCGQINKLTNKFCIKCGSIL